MTGCQSAAFKQRSLSGLSHRPRVIRFYGALEGLKLPKDQVNVKYMERERRVLVRAVVPGSRPTNMAEWKSDDGWGIVQSVFDGFSNGTCTMEDFYARLRQ